jgi:AcrR family transcriptional regulator
VPEGGTLRDQQAEFTKQLLLEAARKVIVNGDPDEFTMQKVAEEAGVSHRTVYRYFPSRQALIDEFSDWIEQRFDNNTVSPDRLMHEMGPELRRLFSRFDQHAEYFEAAARLSGGTIRPASQAQRTARMRRVFDDEFSDLDPSSADKAFAVLRYLIGLQTWYTLRDRFGLKDGETGDAVAWAVDVMIDALREGRVPDSESQVREDETSHRTGDE